MYTIGHQSYAPVLRLKQGEYLALSDLRPDVAVQVIPHLIPPPPKEWDPEKGRRLLPEELVYETAKRVAHYWAFRPCLLDPRFLFDPLGEAEAPAWLARLFKVATSAGGRPIPVFELADYEGTRLPGILSVVDGVGVGVAIRLSLTDLVDVKLRERLHQVLLKQLRLKPDSCTIILDMSQADLSLPDVHDMIVTFFERVSEVGLWHSIIFQGTNYPETNPAVVGGTASVSRREWQAWKTACEQDIFVKRGLMYGDFASDSAKFNFAQKGGRTIPHYRYATEAQWVVDRGKKDEPLRLVMPGLARGIVTSGHFAGRGFSHADRMLSDTALGLSGPGNATTWRRINIGHHITRVVADLGPIRGFQVARMSDALPPVQPSMFG